MEKTTINYKTILNFMKVYDYLLLLTRDLENKPTLSIDSKKITITLNENKE